MRNGNWFPASSRAVRKRTEATLRTAPDPGWLFLCPARRHSLADDAARPAAVAGRVRPFQGVAPDWQVGADQRGVAPQVPRGDRTKPGADRGGDRQPIREDDRGGWAARLRRRQEGQRPQAPTPGRYRRYGPEGQGSSRRSS